jgi:hypothetical protein
VTGGLARRLGWLPAAAVGAAAAACAEVAIGLLLYLRGGFLGALTLLLCVEALAFGLGLWAAPREIAPPWSGVRRAWFLLLFALVAGGVLAATWEALGGLASTWLARGLGLAFLAALPLYASAAVLGARALAEGDPPVGAGPAGAVGAAFGFALVGLGRSALRVAPVAYVSAVVLVSAGALVHSTLLEERERRWREWAERATARVEGDAGAEPPLHDRRSRSSGPPTSGMRR